MDWKLLIPILIQVAQQTLDALIDGAKLNENTISGVRIAYLAVDEFYDELVTDPQNVYTDEALDAFLALCEKTAKEGNFKLAVVPE